MVVTISEIEKLLQQVESQKSTKIHTRYLKSPEELQDALTNKSIKLQYGWIGNREHSQKVIAVGTTAENIMLGEMNQYEYLDYGELIDSDREEIPAHFEPEATYAVLVKEEDIIDYFRDYMQEEQYTIYYYNFFEGNPEGDAI